MSSNAIKILDTFESRYTYAKCWLFSDIVLIFIMFKEDRFYYGLN